MRKIRLRKSNENNLAELIQSAINSKEGEMKLTKKQAIALAKSEFWKDMTYFERAKFQLFTGKLCMPFEVFHEAIEKALGRPVYTHEFGLNVKGLKEELLGKRKAPTLKEILDMIPKDKLIVPIIIKEGE